MVDACERCQIHDTWDVSGLCGNGSNDFTASDVFVLKQDFSLLDPAGHRLSRLYQMPPLTCSFALVCVSLGIARSALDDLTEIAQTKCRRSTRRFSPTGLSLKWSSRGRKPALGRRDRFLQNTVEDMWQTVSAGRTTHQPAARTRPHRATTLPETGAAVSGAAIRSPAEARSIRSLAPAARAGCEAGRIIHRRRRHTWEEAGRVSAGPQAEYPGVLAALRFALKSWKTMHDTGGDAPRMRLSSGQTSQKGERS